MASIGRGMAWRRGSECLVPLVVLASAVGCGPRLDAQDYPIAATYDRWVVQGDRVSVLASAAGVDENVRAVTQYQGQPPRISVELENDTLIIDSNCAARPSCSVEIFASLLPDADGALVADLGTLSIGSDLTGGFEAEIGDGSVTGAAVEADSVEAVLESGDVGLTFAQRPTRVDVETGDGQLIVEVPSGDYRLDLSEGATVEGGIVDDVGADASIRMIGPGEVVLRGL
jgi:hypothetical protein